MAAMLTSQLPATLAQFRIWSLKFMW